MKKVVSDIIRINSISQYHQLMGLPKPQHPLVSILRFEDLPVVANEGNIKFIMDFYTVTIKKDCECKVQYGQTHYDFDEGVMSFIAPEQIFTLEGDFTPPTKGWLLAFHPDFVRNYAIGQKIKAYGFFHYAMNEALILSDKEEASVENIFNNIETEYHLPIDNFSQDVIIAQLELLLTYANRYYNRQFITRKAPASDLLTKMEIVLADYFNGHSMVNESLPSVTFLADQLNMSPKYLSDTLRNLTGQSTQQHIQNKVIEKAKQILMVTNLSVSEIAYQLGFEYPQSFNKLFKKKTHLSPLEFRESFN